MQDTMRLSAKGLRWQIVLVLVIALALVGVLVLSQTRAAARTPAPQTPDYRNAQLPLARRVSDLLNRMTMEEKVAQVTTLWVRKPQVEPNTDFSVDRGDFSPEKAATVMKHGIGQIARQRERKGAGQSAEFANALQKWLREQTRLGIPAMFHDEALHGHMAQGSTSFPTPSSNGSISDRRRALRSLMYCSAITTPEGNLPLVFHALWVSCPSITITNRRRGAGISTPARNHSSLLATG